MSEYRDIWQKCVNANKKMARNFEKGKMLFEKLITLYGEDGMIFYSRAEAYEKHKNYEAALRDYEQAVELFPVAHWKKIAQSGSHRVSNKSSVREEEQPNFSKINKAQCDVIHHIYDYTNIPTFARMLALSAVHRIDSEHDAAFIEFRTCIELFVNCYYPDSTEIDLMTKIDNLTNEQNVNTMVIDNMHELRIRGNKSTHSPPTEIAEYEILYYVYIFAQVLEFANTEVYKF